MPSGKINEIGKRRNETDLSIDDMVELDVSEALY